MHLRGEKKEKKKNGKDGSAMSIDIQDCFYGSGGGGGGFFKCSGGNTRVSGHVCDGRFNSG